MNTKQRIHFVILSEEEVRKAAMLVRQAVDLIAEGDKEPGEKLSESATRALWDAFHACAIALDGADESDALLMLSAHRIESAEAEKVST